MAVLLFALRTNLVQNDVKETIMENKRFSVTLSVQDHADSVRLAEANGITLNGLIRSLLKRAIMMPEDLSLLPVQKKSLDQEGTKRD